MVNDLSCSCEIVSFFFELLSFVGGDGVGHALNCDVMEKIMLISFKL